MTNGSQGAPAARLFPRTESAAGPGGVVMRSRRDVAARLNATAVDDQCGRVALDRLTSDRAGSNERGGDGEELPWRCRTLS